jgi:sugar-phosphatase
VTVRAILSDLDGVLVDSARVIERAWRTWAAHRRLDPDEVARAGSGVRTIDVVRRFAPELDAEAEAARLEAWETQNADGVAALPGALELVRAVPPERFAIVTSGTRPLALARLRASGLPQPAVLVTADDVAAGKPDPAGYLLAARRLLVRPQDCVVLEDAPAGVAAGLAAEMTVIGVTTTHDAGELSAAHRRIASLAELLPLPRLVGDA